MEAQTETSQAQLQSPPQGSETPRLRPQPSTSVPSLRFPKPHGSRRLANWLANSDPGLLHQPANMSDAEDLGGSTFELVDPLDSESQDDRVTEYNSDLDVIRTTSEVHSLAESERSYDSDSEDEQGSRTRSLFFANQALQSPSLSQLAGLGAAREVGFSAAEGRNKRARAEEDERDLDTPSEDDDDDGEDDYGEDDEDDDGTEAAGKLSGLLSLFKSLSSDLGSQERIMRILGNRHFLAIVAPLVMSLVAAIFYGPALSGVSSTPAPHNTLQPMVAPLSTAVATPVKSTPTTSTAVINIKTSQAEPTTSALASAMSYVGLLSDKPSDAADQDAKKASFCTVDVYSKEEILIKLPSRSKAVWLAKGAIDIDVYRGEQPIRSKLSSSDEGILVGLRKQDAWGVLNVSVVTTRRPKINETFEVNFGRPLAVEALEASIHGLKNIFRKLANPTDNLAREIAADFGQLRSSIVDGISEAGRAAQEVTVGAAHDAMERVKKSDMTTFFKDAQDQLSRQLPSAKNARDDVGFTVLRASIGARITWLKMQGKAEEADVYERKARVFLKAKHTELLQARKAREEARTASTKKMDASPWSRRMCSGRSGLKKFRRGSGKTTDDRKTWRKPFWSE